MKPFAKGHFTNAPLPQGKSGTGGIFVCTTHVFFFNLDRKKEVSMRNRYFTKALLVEAANRGPGWDTTGS
jgi:hypothetical protein